MNLLLLIICLVNTLVLGLNVIVMIRNFIDHDWTRWWHIAFIGIFVAAFLFGVWGTYWGFALWIQEGKK